MRITRNASIRTCAAIILTASVITVTLTGCTNKANAPLATPTPTAAATITSSVTPTPTNVATPTPTATAAPSPTGEITPTPTDAPTPTPTSAPSDPCDQVQCASGYYCLNGTCVESMLFSPIPDIKIATLSVCGDGICSASENSSGSCCNDCGCPTGKICSNNSCVTGTSMHIFRPITIVPFFVSKETIITSNASGAPAIDGNKIVFSGYVAAGQPRIQIYDLSTKTLTTLPHDEDSYAPDISGGRIVFEDSSIRPSEGTDIYYYSLTEGVEGIICPRDCYQYDPKIYNNAVVWSETDYLRFYWLPSQEERNIYHVDGKIQGTYDVWGGYVAYFLGDCSHGVPCDYGVYLYNIATDKTQTIISTSGYIGDVAIYNNKIAYAYGADIDALNIYIYDINTELTTKITNSVSNKEGLSIYENTVVWSDDRNGNYDIYMYDMDTATETQVSSDSHAEQYPDVYGNFIVYKRGNTNIVLYSID